MFSFLWPFLHFSLYNSNYSIFKPLTPFSNAGTYSGSLNTNISFGRLNLTITCPSSNCTFRTSLLPVLKLVDSNGDVAIHGLYFDNCSTTGSGGAISMTNSRLTVLNSTFMGCTAAYGGGIAMSRSSLTVRNSLFESCTAGTGGALFVTNKSNLTIDASNVVSATAAHGGGGIFVSHHSVIRALLSTFSQSKSFGSLGGGAVYFFFYLHHKFT